VAEQVMASDPPARAGEDALETAVRDHARLLYRIAYTVLRNHHDAEDATQEAFLRALRYGRTLEGVRDPKNWLARIAWRVALDRRRRVPEVPLGDEQATLEPLRSAVKGAEEELLGAEMTALLGRMIRALPPRLRDALTLSTVREMSLPDVAEVLGIPEAAVRSRLFRARQILKQRLLARLGGPHGA
jgi:RNA polymerase sigma-70 factor (ECF subfamily)